MIDKILSERLCAGSKDHRPKCNSTSIGLTIKKWTITTGLLGSNKPMNKENHIKAIRETVFSYGLFFVLLKHICFG